MKRQFNYLSLLSLLSLVGFLGITTGNNGFYGFFGFLYYLRYLWVIPDELFQLNVRKVATVSFFTQMISLVPLLFVCCLIWDASRAIPMAFALSFVVAVFVFSLYLMYLELKESRGVHDD